MSTKDPYARPLRREDHHVQERATRDLQVLIHRGHRLAAYLPNPIEKLPLESIERLDQHLHQLLGDGVPINLEELEGVR